MGGDAGHRIRLLADPGRSRDQAGPPPTRSVNLTRTRHHDVLYSVQALVREDGTVAERYKYEPYGRATVLNADGSVKVDSGYSEFGNPYTFTGRRVDEETGLMYYRNRYYSTDLGRFVGRDPIDYEGSKWNLYEYVDSGPTTHSDAMGLTRPTSCVWLGVVRGPFVKTYQWPVITWGVGPGGVPTPVGGAIAWLRDCEYRCVCSAWCGSDNKHYDVTAATWNGMWGGTGAAYVGPLCPAWPAAGMPIVGLPPHLACGKICSSCEGAPDF